MQDQCRKTDIIIIGAGAAGIGAALACQSKGVSYVVLEGNNRVGGRAYTATAGLEQQWDLGCHWMHSASLNAFVSYAEQHSAHYLKRSGWEHSLIWANGGFVETAAVTEAKAELDSAIQAVLKTGETGRDIAIAAALPKGGSWDRWVRHVMQLDVGDDPEATSTSAYADTEDTGEDWPVLSGYGALLAKMADGLNIRLHASVASVEETGSGVNVTSSDGVYEAKAAIVTVSTNVLSSGAIDFAPGPAADFVQQTKFIPCGAYEKIAFSLSELPENLGVARHVVVHPSGIAPAMDFKIIEQDAPLIVATVAGSPARELMAMPRADRIAFVFDRLSMVFGAGFGDLVTGSACTEWLHDPFFLGSYSYALPGYAQLRRDMIAEDTGLIAFAGEAFSLRHQATAHGAFESGRDKAKHMIGRLDRGSR